MQIAAYTFLFLTVIYLLRMGLWLRAWKNIRVQPESRAKQMPLSVVICFRNEREKLPVLLAQLLPQLHHVAGSEIILVDDHSTDQSAEDIQEIIAGNHEVRLFRPTEHAGKKACQHFAVSQTKNEWIATLDADVSIGDQWLRTLSGETYAAQSELLILPLAVDDHRSVFTQLQSLEFFSILFATASGAASGNAILCNGANLAFRKKLFMEFMSGRKDLNISSGDDIFLLAFAKKRNPVNWIHDKRLLATTAGETRLTSFLAQRVRWASKTSGVNNRPMLAAAVLIFLINISLVICAAWQGLTGQLSNTWLIGFGLKTLMDYLILRKVAIWLCKTRLMRFFPILVILYPLYAILIPLLGTIWKPRWKERRIKI